QELVQAPELTAAVQDYAKAIYTLETRDGTVSTTALAERLDVRPASVSGMLRKLAVLGLVEHERYHGVHLTERGRLVALEVMRHLAERGIAPRARLEVVERQPFDGPLYARSGGEVHVLGATLARAMRVSEDA